MKHISAGIASISFVVCLSCAPSAQAGHGARIDEGNGAGCMTTWQVASDQSAAAAFSPGGTFGSIVACTPNSSSTDDLFPNGVPANDSFTAAGGGASFLANGGEMFQFYLGLPSAQPDAQVVAWSLANTDTEIEMNGWCPGGTAGSFTWGAATYTGGCNGAATDFLFNSGKGFIGFVDDTSDTVKFVSELPTGWTSNGGTITTAPEINASSAAVALTFLAGGLAVLRGRRPLRSPR
jgi:hypothetical protein